MMRNRWIQRPSLLGLGLTAALCAGVSGCGGSPEVGDAVVVTPPGTTPAPAAAPAANTAAAPAPAATPSTAAPAAASPVKAEGWGTLKGKVVLSGDPPAPKPLVEQGKAVILISSEMTELMGLSDRVLVFAEGRVTGALDRSEFSQGRILELASRFGDQP